MVGLNTKLAALFTRLSSESAIFNGATNSALSISFVFISIFPSFVCFFPSVSFSNFSFQPCSCGFFSASCQLFFHPNWVFAFFIETIFFVKLCAIFTFSKMAVCHHFVFVKFLNRFGYVAFKAGFLVHGQSYHQRITDATFLIKKGSKYRLAHFQGWLLWEENERLNRFSCIRLQTRIPFRFQ